MSQDVSTNERATKVLTASTPIPHWSAEADADKLMDDLFADIDRILEGSSKLPTEPAKPDYVSLQSLTIPQIIMPPALRPPQELPLEPPSSPNQETPEQVKEVETSLTHTASSSTKRSRWSLDKLLLALGLVSVGVTTLLVLVSQKRLSWPWWLNFAASTSTQNRQPTQEDYKFGVYALRSLGVMDRKKEAKQQTAMASGGNNKTNLPPGSAAGSRPAGAIPPTTVLERIYYPVYPPQASWVPPMNFSATTPPATAPIRTAIPPTTPPQAAAPGSQSSSAAPIPRASATLSAPRTSAAAPVPSNPATVPLPPPVAAASPAPPPAPPVKHTLVGLLELGERSAALFEIDGITQRINVGESIGGSGWTLVSVANQEAVVRRNGEVRSVYVGQTF